FPPGTPPLPPMPVAVDGAFTYPNVPANNGGLDDYTATRIVCTALQAQTPPQPCTGPIDLSQQGTQFGTYDGTITSSARVVTLVLNVNQSGSIDPTNPGIGTLSIVGTLCGTSSPVPRYGDANLDGIVDSGDLQDFVNVMINPTAF